MKNYPLVSIITVVLNGKDTIEDAIKSVLGQSYKNIEYIVVDGGSTDGTIEIIEKYKDKISKFVSEKDRGLYDAMNKGIKMATGDIIGILNADDFYVDNKVIEDVVQVITEKEVDSCYGDILYVDRNDINKVIRYWKSKDYAKERFRWGWMPPHPAFFVKRKVYEKYGYFDINFKISADYELILRFLYKHKISSAYLPRVLVKMRTGGRSRPGLINTLKANFECYKAWKKNGLKGGEIAVFLKPLSKIPQFFHK